MSRTIEKTIFTLAELTGSARDRALQWLSEGVDGFAEPIIKDFEQVCALIGVELDTHTVPLMNGKSRQEPCVYFSGFWSQGDGASFEGTYRYQAGGAKAVRKYAPKDRELHLIADALQAAQKPYLYQLEASVTTRGNYSHSGTMAVDVAHRECESRDVSKSEDAIKDALRNLADWLYTQLDREYAFQTSEEALLETAEANDYEFDENGRIV